MQRWKSLKNQDSSDTSDSNSDCDYSIHLHSDKNIDASLVSPSTENLESEIVVDNRSTHSSSTSSPKTHDISHEYDVNECSDINSDYSTSCTSNLSSNTSSNNNDFSDLSSDSSFDTDSCESDKQVNSVDELDKTSSQAVAVLSCFMRNNFSISASKDILNTMTSTFSDSPSISNHTYESIWNIADQMSCTVIHYCTKCYSVFPSNPDVYACNTANCDGLRYKGSVTHQEKKGRQPAQLFVIADINQQLNSLLSSDGKSF